MLTFVFCFVSMVKFKGYSVDEISACTLLMEGSAAVSSGCGHLSLPSGVA